MATVHRVAATDAVEFGDAMAVREAVFVEEQGVPPDLERDDADAEATTDHFVAVDDGRTVGAARLRPATDGHGEGTDGSDADGGVDSTGTAKVERVAVLARERGRGVGRRLMTAVEARARERGFARVVLHAQTPVESWYRSLGYETVGEAFEEAGIPHVEMRKRL